MAFVELDRLCQDAADLNSPSLLCRSINRTSASCEHKCGEGQLSAYVMDSTTFLCDSGQLSPSFVPDCSGGYGMGV